MRRRAAACLCGPRRANFWSAREMSKRITGPAIDPSLIGWLWASATFFLFVAQSPTPSDQCVCVASAASAVADDCATLASRRRATTLPGLVFHRQERVSFAGRTGTTSSKSGFLQRRVCKPWTRRHTCCSEKLRKLSVAQRAETGSSRNCEARATWIPVWEFVDPSEGVSNGPLRLTNI
jgi:hypothetical protein